MHGEEQDSMQTKNAGWQKSPEKLVIKEINVTYMDALDIDLAPGGGQAIHFKTIK